MRRILISGFLLLLLLVNANAQNYYYEKTMQLPMINLTAETVDLSYPIALDNVKAIGMGNTQIANGKTFNAMIYNPAFLGRYKKSFEVFGIGASMPPDTYNAAWFLADNMDEFLDATSLTQVYDAADAFFQAENNQQRLEYLHDIQDGMQFTMDLVEQVTGPYNDPYHHGVGIAPSINVQYGNWGFSLFGYGYSGFTVFLSPTLETLTNISVPQNLDHPVLVARSMAQMLATLSTVFLSPSEGFTNEVYPVALYMSYIDAVGTLGYGFQWKKNWLFGANLKIVNRRFSMNRIAVVDYDEILDEALSVLDAGIVGVTADVGCVYESSFGTNFGLSLQNIIPVQSIEKVVNIQFRVPNLIVYNGKETQQVKTNADGDTAIVSTFRQVNLDRPFELKSPFIANFGISHQVIPNWEVSVDWVDIAEQDSRYEKTTDRIRLGTEFRFNFWKKRIAVALRAGMADERMAFGLGLNLTRHVQIDGAYAYDRFVDTFSYFGQLSFGW